MPENPDLTKINLRLKVDRALVEEQIDLIEFMRKHKLEEREIWDEMPIVARDPLFLNSFLKKLTPEKRIIAIKDMYRLSYKDLKELGIGGSVNRYCKGGTIKDLRNLPTQLINLSIVLDIPLEYLLKEKPNSSSFGQFLEYSLVGKEITIDKIKEYINRPKYREVEVFCVENKNDSNNILDINSDYINLRIDLLKSFYTLDFHITSRICLDYKSIKKMIKLINLKISYIVLSHPILRDTYKLSFIGSYMQEEYKRVEEYKNILIQYNNGVLLYPFKNIEDIYR